MSRVMTLGALRAVPSATTEASLPSSSAVKAVLDGEPMGWPKVFATTLLRGGLIAPGLFVAGVRGKQLVFGAIGGAVGITLFLFLFYGWKRTQQN